MDKLANISLKLDSNSSLLSEYGCKFHCWTHHYSSSENNTSRTK